MQASRPCSPSTSDAGSRVEPVEAVAQPGNSSRHGGLVAFLDDPRTDQLHLEHPAVTDCQDLGEKALQRYVAVAWHGAAVPRLGRNDVVADLDERHPVEV